MTELTKKYKEKLKKAIEKQKAKKRVIMFDPEIEREIKRVEQYNRAYDKNGWFYGHW